MNENYDVSQEIVDVVVEDVTEKEEQSQEEQEPVTLTGDQLKELIANYKNQRKKEKVERKRKQSFAYEVGRLDGITSARRKQIGLNRLINKVQRENDMRKKQEQETNDG